jgi:hypothetical protein
MGAHSKDPHKRAFAMDLVLPILEIKNKNTKRL